MAILPESIHITDEALLAFIDALTSIQQAEMIVSSSKLFYHPNDSSLFAQLSRLTSVEVAEQETLLQRDSPIVTYDYHSLMIPPQNIQYPARVRDMSWAVGLDKAGIDLQTIQSRYADLKKSKLYNLTDYDPLYNLSQDITYPTGFDLYAFLVTEYIEYKYPIGDIKGLHPNFVAGSFRDNHDKAPMFEIEIKTTMFLKDSGFKSLYNTTPAYVNKQYHWTWQDTENMFLLLKYSHKLTQISHDSVWCGSPLSVYKLDQY